MKVYLPSVMLHPAGNLVTAKTLNNLIETSKPLLYYNIPKIVTSTLMTRIDKYTPIWKFRPDLNYYL